MAGTVDQQSVGAEQPVIHAPGIDADAVELELAFAGGDADALLNLMPETERVPIQGAQHAHRRIREAMQFLNFELAAGKAAKQRAPALGPQIDRQIVTHENASIVRGASSRASLPRISRLP